MGEGVKEQPSPYPQRPMEPGDWVLVVLGNGCKHSGHVGQIMDYGPRDGEYRVDGINYPIHRSNLWQFEWDWSGT